MSLIAGLIQKRTDVEIRWVAERLAMRHEGNVTRVIRRVNDHPVRRKNLTELEAMLVNRD